MTKVINTGPEVARTRRRSDHYGRVEKIEHAMESNVGQASFRIYMIFISLLVTILLTMSTVWLGQIKDKTETGVVDNIRQDQAIIKQQALMDYNGHRIDALERASDAQIAALQVMVTQVTRLGDKIDAAEGIHPLRKGT